MAITVAEKVLKLLNSSGHALRVGYDSSNYAGFQADSSGNLTIDVTGTKVTIADDLVVSGDEVHMANLPISDPTVAGQLWNDSGTLKVSAG